MEKIEYGRDFRIKKGRVQWNETIEGVELLAQAHFLRKSCNKTSYKLYPEYGSLEQEIIQSDYGEDEMRMRMDIAIKDVCMQDKRIIAADLNKESIKQIGEVISYKYIFQTFDGKTVPQQYLSLDYAD